MVVGSASELLLAEAVWKMMMVMMIRSPPRMMVHQLSRPSNARSTALLPPHHQGPPQAAVREPSDHPGPFCCWGPGLLRMILHQGPQVVPEPSEPGFFCWGPPGLLLLGLLHLFHGEQQLLLKLLKLSLMTWLNPNFGPFGNQKF